jgi:Flp pilus assembly protein TadD
LKLRRLALFAGPCVAILIYLPTIGHEFVFDDRGAIEANPLVHDLRDLPRIPLSPYWTSIGGPGSLYRPLTNITFAIDRAIARGLKPGWFHFVNVILHGLATLLVVLVARRILPGTAGPAIAGLLFAVHPVHVEAVAGVVGRSEMLAACGVLTAVLCHRRALESAPLGASWAGAAWGASLLGMLSKESAVTAPILCLLIDRALSVSSGPARRRRRVLYVGHAITLIAYLAARAAVMGTIMLGAPIHFVDNPAASAGPIDGRLTALGTLPRYAGLLLWPSRLSADYSFDQLPILRSLAEPMVLGGIALILVVVGGGVLLMRRAPAVGLSLLWIAISASLTCNLLLFIGTLLAERLMYLPSVGLCLLVGWGIASVPPRWLAPACLVALGIGAVGAARSAIRIPQWKDDFSLYRSAAEISPRSARIRFNLGNAFLRRSQFEMAEESYRAALAIYRDFGDARLNLGMAVLQQGRAREAIEHFTAVIERHPEESEAKVNLGVAHRMLGEDALAERLLFEALEVDPRLAKAWNNLGSISLARGEMEEAIARMQTAVELDPRLAIFRVNLADALNADGRHDEADVQFRAAYRMDPLLPEARRGWGELALRREDLVTAEREFRAAASGSPPSARAANFLGFLLGRRGEVRGAVEAYELALRIDPTLHDAHNNLGMLYAEQLGQPEKGVAHLRRSLEIAPVQLGAEEIRRRLEALRSRVREAD